MVKMQKQLNQIQIHNKNKDTEKKEEKLQEKKIIFQLFKVTFKISGLLPSLKIEKIKQK